MDNYVGPQPTIKLTETDRKILGLLSQDSRRSVSELSVIIGVSRATIRQRIDLMKSAGVIERFTITINEQANTRPNMTTAFLLLELKRPVCKIVYDTIRGWPELLGSWSLAGDLDMAILLETTSTSELERLRESLSRHPDIKQLKTFPVLRNWVTRS